MNTLILVFVLLGLLFYTLKRPLYGLMYYFTVRMVIPASARVGSLSFNTIMLTVILLLTIAYFYKCYNMYCQQERRLLKSVLVFCFFIILLTFFSPLLSLTYQWGQLFQTVGTEILPSILLMYYLQKNEEVKVFCYVVAICALFSSLYGIYTYATSINPIYEFFNTSLKDSTDLEQYATNRYGLTGISVGIYDDKIAMSLISFLLAMFLFDKEIIKLYTRYMLVGLTIVNMILTSQRSALLCFIIFILIQFWGRNQVKFRKKAILFSVIGGLFLLTIKIEVVDQFFLSIFFLFDDKAQDNINIDGSSSSMRISQLVNIIDYQDVFTIFTGQGYGFTHYYYTVIHDVSIYGTDNRFFGFESFLLRELMNVGIVGMIIWIILLVKVYKILSVHLNIVFIAMYLSYVLVALMTDMSASFYLFFFLIVLNYKYYTLMKKCHSK